MPRLRRRGHMLRDEYGGLSRAQLIRALADDVRYPDVDSPLLKHTPESDRQAIVDEALELAFAEREERREATLRERLNTWPCDSWGALFAEIPHLREELTPDQTAQWQGWREEARRRKLRETGENIIAIPAVKEIQ